MFATLDVTVHDGQLPSGLHTLYADTVGFVSDIPSWLAPCFDATLEDVLLADVVLHVVDISHEEVSTQTAHVEQSLRKIYENAGQTPAPVISVGNKVDRLKQPVSFQTDVNVSASNLIGKHNFLSI